MVVSLIQNSVVAGLLLAFTVTSKVVAAALLTVGAEGAFANVQKATLAPYPVPDVFVA